ncbi:hypothetical protein ACFQ21_05235 [Ohtaekwangia kribbensis]|uniref:Uncharacterized protein n=1 Tax=Ohtaekwangia kribbensis TaxID=688913 RepID=A0ABW3K132_9BACT
MKTKDLIVYSLIMLFAILGCSESDTASDQQVFSSTSVFDKDLGDYVATNFYDYEFQWVDAKNGRTEGLSANQEIRLGIEPNSSLEADGALPAGTVLTGIGARVNSNRNVSTLTLEYRYLNADGTLGPRYRIQLGTEPQYTPTEVWYAVPPDNKVITGVGFRARYNNMQTMWVYYRSVIAQSDGTLLLSGLPQEVRVGVEPNYQCEVLYTPNFGNTDNDKAIITGVGLRCDNNSNIATMKILAAFMQP